MEKIQEVFEEEVNLRVERRLTGYVEYISKTYNISLELLLKDLKNMKHQEVIVPQCIALNGKGKRCKFNAKSDGYCGHHSKKCQPCRPQIEEVKHNHSMPPFTSDNCPACKQFKRENLSFI